MFDGLLQPTHLILILVVALLVVGPKKLPEMGRSLGSGMRGFKDAISGNDEPVAITPAEPQVPVVASTVTAASTLPGAEPTPAAAPAAVAEPVDLDKA